MARDRCSKTGHVQSRPIRLRGRRLRHEPSRQHRYQRYPLPPNAPGWLIAQRCTVEYQTPSATRPRAFVDSDCRTVQSHCLASISHTRTVLSPDAVASRLPSGDHASCVTPLVWPVKVAMLAPVSASQTMTVPSQVAAASLLLSGDHTTIPPPGTVVRSPARVCKSAPVAPSHTRTVSSEPAEASLLPSGDHATCSTAPVWSVRVSRLVAAHGVPYAYSLVIT